MRRKTIIYLQTRLQLSNKQIPFKLVIERKKTRSDLIPEGKIPHAEGKLTTTRGMPNQEETEKAKRVLV